MYYSCTINAGNLGVCSVPYVQKGLLVGQAGVGAEYLGNALRHEEDIPRSKLRERLQILIAVTLFRTRSLLW